MERTLILNAGSSSVKFRVYENAKIALDGVVDRIGPKAKLVVAGERAHAIPARTHKQAGLFLLGMIKGKIHKVVHRVVHGGSYRKPMTITATVRRSLEKLTPLAPLHMPPALALIDVCSSHTGAEQIACFDTMFHRTLPRVAKTYAIPQKLAKKYGIEHYGFHGLAHEDMLLQGLALLERKTASRMRIITCQLGNGASVCAIKNGKSVDTTMGFTPLQGLVMGTRSGDIDPAIIEFLCEHEEMTVEEVTEMLEERSGLLALAGSNDVRDILAMEKRGDTRAKLALDMFAYHVRKKIGSYMAVLGGVDMIVLGGGVSQSPVIRERILSGLEGFDIAFDQRSIRKREPALVSTGDVPVFVVTVDEAERMFMLSS